MTDSEWLKPEMLLRAKRSTSAYIIPVNNPPDKQLLMSPKSVIVGRDVPGQDGGGHHVGDRYEEQPGGGQSQKPGVFY